MTMHGGSTLTMHGDIGDQVLLCAAPQLSAVQLAWCLACHGGLGLILASSCSMASSRCWNLPDCASTLVQQSGRQGAWQLSAASALLA